MIWSIWSSNIWYDYVWLSVWSSYISQDKSACLVGGKFSFPFLNFCWSSGLQNGGKKNAVRPNLENLSQHLHQWAPSTLGKEQGKYASLLFCIQLIKLPEWHLKSINTFLLFDICHSSLFFFIFSMSIYGEHKTLLQFNHYLIPNINHTYQLHAQ